MNVHNARVEAAASAAANTLSKGAERARWLQGQMHSLRHTEEDWDTQDEKEWASLELMLRQLYGEFNLEGEGF